MAVLKEMSAKLLIVVSLLVVSFSRFTLAQDAIPPEFRTDDLQIISPADGSIVTPGQTITVVVDVAPGSSFSHVGVIGKDIGMSLSMTSAPFEFLLTIPNDLIGPKTLTAVGITAPGSGLFSEPVTINIETSAFLTSLSTNLKQISFKFTGETLTLNVTGTFDDGVILNITRSTLTTYSSGDISVATVDANGVVTAAGAGVTNIFVDYAGQSVAVPVSVPEAVQGDLNSDGRVNRDDLNILLSAIKINGPVTGLFDARDLNGDGVIDPLDEQIIREIIGVSADLSVIIAPFPEPVTLGENLTYTVTVTNDGPDDASDVMVMDVLQREVTFVSSSLSQGRPTCLVVGGRATCNLGTLASGASATVTIVVTPTQVGTISNFASVTSGVPDPDGTNDAADVITTVLESFIPVQIDIKPGSFPNSINLGSKGVVPVAVLSTGAFDAATVDAATLTLSGAEVQLKGKSGKAGSLEDVNSDGLLDLVVHFKTGQLELTEESTEAVLSGLTLDGIPIRGSDSVRIVPAKRPRS